MKRTIIRYEDVVGFHPLFNAWKKVSTGNGKDRRKDVIAYAPHVEENLHKLHDRLVAGTWRPDEGRKFRLFTEGKWREIHIVDVETRIVYQALVTAFGIKRRIDFCGWAVDRESNRVRTSTVRRYRKRLRMMGRHPLRINKEMSVIASYQGILRHGDAYKLNLKLRKDYDEVFDRINRYTARKRLEVGKVATPKPGRGRVQEVLGRAHGEPHADGQ